MKRVSNLFVQPSFQLNTSQFFTSCVMILQGFHANLPISRSAIDLIQRLFETSLFGDVSKIKVSIKGVPCYKVEINLGGVKLIKVFCEDNDTALDHFFGDNTAHATNF